MLHIKSVSNYSQVAFFRVSLYLRVIVIFPISRELYISWFFNDSKMRSIIIILSRFSHQYLCEKVWSSRRSWREVTDSCCLSALNGNEVVSALVWVSSYRLGCEQARVVFSFSLSTGKCTISLSPSCRSREQHNVGVPVNDDALEANARFHGESASTTALTNAFVAAVETNNHRLRDDALLCR